MRELIVLMVLLAVTGCHATNRLSLSVEQPTAAGGIARATWSTEVLR